MGGVGDMKVCENLTCDVIKSLRDGRIFFPVNNRYSTSINMTRLCAYAAFVFNTLNINTRVCMCYI